MLGQRLRTFDGILLRFAAPQHQSADVWERYKEPATAKRWWCRGDAWFFEGDDEWEAYQDEAGERWWWNPSSEVWFFAATGSHERRHA